ncbi:hypothetical protein FRUB_07708 [Fimbriiglobus ruber]|uniref:DUF1501 domain-containing protein n=1 Tax=Fimbriiglobus ruber TaxID=1908690 RepID=A0A225DJ38_9BACT|nr:hypothetical protein FRUB_07708 [Fimbriiglobus ruber]
MGAFATPAVANELKKRRKQVLFVWLDGGMSQLESWDPKPNTTFGGPFRAIPTSVPGIHISELLPDTAKQMHRLALVRSVSTQDNSHSAGVDRIQRGDPKNRGVTYPYFGSAVAKLLGPGDGGLPPYVWVKPGNGGFIYKDAGFLGPQYGALALGDGKPPENLVRPPDLPAEADAARNELRKLADKRYAAGRRTELTEANSFAFDTADQLQRQLDLFDSAKLPAKDRDRYGTHDLGRHMLLARRLLEAGVTFVKVTSYGWDTHGDHFNGTASLHPKFDRPFAAIVQDLADRGMLDDVLVIVAAEFGRTPRINGHLGRDHWPEAWSVCMAGRGIKPGVAAGKTNALGTDVATEPHDIGHLFHTWYAALGIDAAAKHFYNAGQPLPIAHEEMHPVKEVLA